MEENQEPIQEKQEVNHELDTKKFVTTNKTPLLITALVVLTGILLAVSLAPKKSAILPDLAKKIAVKSAAQTTLAIPTPQASTASAKYETQVNINSGSNNVTGVQIEISYNPTEITVIDVKPGPFIKNPVILLKKIDPVNGTITYVLGTPLGKKGIKGKGAVAIILFNKGNVTSEKEVTLEFLPRTIVTADGTSESTLKETISAKFKLE